MMIRSIDFKHFRGVKSGKVEGFERINFFVGKNNSGKTTLLESIFLSIGFSNPLLPIRIDGFRNLAHNDEDDFRFVFYNLDYGNKPKFTLTLSDEDRVRTLELCPNKKETSSGKRTSKKTIEELDDLSYDTRIESQNVNGIILKSTIKKRHSQAKKFESKVTRTQGAIQSEIPPNYEERINGVFIFPGTQSPQLDKRVEKLIVNKQTKLVVDILKVIDPKISDISLGTNGMIYLDIGIDRLVPLNLSGDGIRRILSMTATAIDMANGIIFIDEIDNGLHYSAQEALLSALLSLAVKFNLQIFATTHNYETLEKLNDILESKPFESMQKDVKIFTLRKLDDDTLKAYPYAFTEFNHVLDEEIEIR